MRQKIDRLKLIDNLNVMINALEYDSMRSSGKMKMNSPHLHAMYYLLDEYKQQEKSKSGPKPQDPDNPRPRLKPGPKPKIKPVEDQESQVKLKLGPKPKGGLDPDLVDRVRESLAESEVD